MRQIEREGIKIENNGLAKELKKIISDVTERTD